MWNNLSETKKQLYIFGVIFLGTLANMILAAVWLPLFLGVSLFTVIFGSIWMAWELAEDWNRWENNND